MLKSSNCSLLAIGRSLNAGQKNLICIERQM
jgi:hypothetical protein